MSGKSKLPILYLYATQQRFPDKVALVDEHHSVTFRELWQNALRLSLALQKSIEQVNTPILIDIDKSVAAVIAMCAVQLSHNIYVPLDTASPADRRKRLENQLGPHHTLGLDSKTDGANTFSFVLDDNAVESAETVSQDDEHTFIQALQTRSDQDPIYIIFTSGTTGTPKGVTIKHESVVDYIDWAVTTYSVNAEDSIANQAPLYFDNSVLDIYLCLATGASLHLLPQSRFLFLSDALDYLEQHTITLVFFVPSIFANMAASDLLQNHRLDSLSKILFAGEVMPVTTLAYLRQHFPNALLSNLYGPTEITVDASYWICPQSITGLADVPIGIPCDNTSIQLLGDDDEIIMENDRVGEITVGGTGVALGYWNDEEKTRRAFIQNPAHSEFTDIIYRTGDLGYFSGNPPLLYIKGRIDDQIKHMGYRIELGEIEAALVSTTMVNQACVAYNSERKEILAFITCHAESADTQEKELVKQIRKHIGAQLPKYMLPKSITLLTEMPITKNGKIDRQTLLNGRA